MYDINFINKFRSLFSVYTTGASILFSILMGHLVQKCLLSVRQTGLRSHQNMHTFTGVIICEISFTS